MRKYQKAGSVKKEPKPKTTTTKNIFGRTSTYTQTGPDRDNTFKETITDRKGRVRREVSGTYKEDKTGDTVLENETNTRYNKKGVAVKEKKFSAVGPSTAYTMDKSTTKKGVPIRSMNYVYKEEPARDIEITTRTNRKGKVRVNDQSSSNINTPTTRVVPPLKKGGHIKKYQTPGSVVLGAPKRTRLSVVSPNGDYKTTTRTRNTPNSNSQSTRTRRTVQGALKGAPKVNMVNPPLNNSAVPLTPPSSGSFMKRGGSKKSTMIKKKK